MPNTHRRRDSARQLRRVGVGGVYWALALSLNVTYRIVAHAQEDNNDFRSSYSSSTLVIMTFMPRFQGNYTCVASNVFRMKKQTFYVNGRLLTNQLSSHLFVYITCSPI